MRVLVVGAGATGGYFGGRLAEHGAEVRFLVRPARARLLRETGLLIRSPFGDATIRDGFLTARDLDGGYDLILIACKAFDLEQVMADIAPAVASHSLVLPLLNGLSHLDRLDAAYGAERVLGAVCYISSVIAPDGAIEHLNRAQDLIVGGRSAATDPQRLEAALTLLASGGFRLRRAPQVMQDMWEKFVFIATVAAITTLGRSAIGPILETGNGAAVALALRDECAATAAASGFPLRPKAVETTTRTITEAGSSFTASMLRDLKDRRPIEADAILGDMLRRAAAAAVPAPTLRAAYLPLETYMAGLTQTEP